MKNQTLAGAVFMSIVLLISTTSQADFEQIDWHDFIGTNVQFLGITESSATDTLDIDGDGILGNNDGLYGRPTISGDSLLFTDLDFFSSSSGIASDITDGKLEGTIQGKPNSYVDKIRFEEWGDVSLSGFTPSNAYAAVANNFFLTITEIDNYALLDPIVLQFAMVISPSDGDWLLTDDGFFTGRQWSGELIIDITQELRKLGINGYATNCYFAMDNTLTTQSMEGTSAYIAKKQTDGLKVTVEIVPEPATLALLALGGLLLRKRG